MTPLDKTRRNALRLSLPFLLFLLLSPLLTNYVRCGTSSAGPLTEGTYWAYSFINKTEAQGVGSYDGRYEYLEDSKVQAVITKSDSSTLVIEERVESDVSIRGTNFFTQRRDYHSSIVITSAVDPRTLTYASYRIRDIATNETRDDPSKKGKPVSHFVRPTLSESFDAPYFWRGEELSCTVSKKNMDFQGSKVPVIMLHYSGPKKLTTHLGVFRFGEYGTAEGVFMFDGFAGLRILSSAKETAKLSSSACCSVTVTNAENYTLQTTNLQGISKSVQPPIVPAPASTPGAYATPPTQGTPSATGPGTTMTSITTLFGDVWSLTVPVASLIVAVLLYFYLRKTKHRPR
jgi:hypothetical protein